MEIKLANKPTEGITISVDLSGIDVLDFQQALEDKVHKAFYEAFEEIAWSYKQKVLETLESAKKKEDDIARFDIAWEKAKEKRA